MEETTIRVVKIRNSKLWFPISKEDAAKLPIGCDLVVSQETIDEWLKIQRDWEAMSAEIQQVFQDQDPRYHSRPNWFIG